MWLKEEKGGQAPHKKIFKEIMNENFQFNENYKPTDPRHSINPKYRAYSKTKTRIAADFLPEKFKWQHNWSPKKLMGQWRNQI